MLQSFKHCLLRTKFLGIGSIIGIIIGLIPGAGGQIAGLVSWDQARKMSKDKDSFGKGNRKKVRSAFFGKASVTNRAVTRELH